MKVAKYSGDDDWDDYLNTFEVAALYNNWADAEKLFHLINALEKDARSVFMENPRGNYPELVAALQTRFQPPDQMSSYQNQLQTRSFIPGENAMQYSADLRRLARKAFPEVRGKALDQLVLTYFVGGIRFDSVVR